MSDQQSTEPPQTEIKIFYPNGDFGVISGPGLSVDRIDGFLSIRGVGGKTIGEWSPGNWASWTVTKGETIR